MKALSIIKTEHRRLNAVLFTLKRLVSEIEKGDKNVPFEVFHGIVFYLDSFLDRYHHPKENKYLFPAVAARHPEAKPIVERLGREHAEGETLMNELVKALSAYEFLGQEGFDRFKRAVERYVQFEQNHASSEERELMPLAQTYLADTDWEKIDHAFTDHDDPLFGERPSAAFRSLYDRLIALVPAPYGLGSA